MTIHRILLALCGCVGLILSSCTADVTLQGLTEQQKSQARQCRASTPQSKKIQRNGSVLGCLSSLALSRMAGFEQSATLICASGGLAGYLIGHNVAERRCEYITLERQLDGEIRHLEQMNQRFELLLLEQQANLRLLDDTVKGLAEKQKQSQKHRFSQADLAQKDKLLSQVIDRLVEERYVLDQLEVEQIFTEETLQKAQRQGDAISRKTEVKRLEQNLVLLKQNIAKVDSNNDALLKINTLLMALCNCDK